MLSEKEIPKYPLDKVVAKVAEALPDSEFFVERCGISAPADYTRVAVNAKWLPEYGTAIVEVVLHCKPNQLKALKALLADEERADDLDSGIGEVFEEALLRVYPKKKWIAVVGGTKVTAKSEKS